MAPSIILIFGLFSAYMVKQTLNIWSSNPNRGVFVMMILAKIMVIIVEHIDFSLR